MTVGILHTTESDSFDSTDAWFRKNPGIQPHVMIDPASGRVRTYIGYDRPARALANLPGGVETNRRGGVIQVEIVGRAAQMPDMTGEWYRRLAQLLGAIGSDAGVPPVFPCPFVAYPASYGLKAAQRLTPARWEIVAGWIGHQHVPENTHGDPGDLNRLIPLMTGATTVPTPTTDRTAIVTEAQQVLIDAGFLTGKPDGDFGPKTLTALHAMKNHRADLAKANATSADTIKRLVGEVDGLKAAGASYATELVAVRAELKRVNKDRADWEAKAFLAGDELAHLRSTIVADVVADIRAALDKLDGEA